MKNPRKILSKHYDVDNRVDEKAIVQAMKEYAKEASKEALANASKCFMASSYFARETRKSILKESNIPNI